MARGDVQQSPWVWPATDFAGKVVSVTVYFNNATRALTNTGPGGKCAIVHRDSGCRYRTVVFGNPTLSDGVTPDPDAPRLPAPADGDADDGYTVAQVKAASSRQLGFAGGWSTYEDVRTVQITAEP